MDVVFRTPDERFEGLPGYDAATHREVADALSRWEKPTMVAFADNDPVFPYPKSGDRFVELVPGATEQIRIEGAAHFLQEDRGEQIAEELLRFLSPG